MKLVLKYFGSGMDGRDMENCYPVEAESKEQVLYMLREGAEMAALFGQERFIAFNQTHYLHNFLRRVSPAQMQMMTMFCKSRNRPEPKWISQGGLHYKFAPVALEVLTLDEWFATASEEPASDNSELASMRNMTPQEWVDA